MSVQIWLNCAPWNLEQTMDREADIRQTVTGRRSSGWVWGSLRGQPLITSVAFWVMVNNKAPWQFNYLLAPGAIVALGKL